MRLYGLIGYPLEQSFSKKYFTQKFENEGLLECRFENFAIKSIDDLKEILRDNKSLKGLAVTIPYKQQVLSQLHTSQNIPDDLRACNCIKMVGDKLIGFNTDYIGFERSFIPLLNPQHKKALILGNGGSSAAVAYVLKKAAISFSIVSRGLHDGSTLRYNDLTEEVVADHTIIINTTPLGMFPNNHAYPPIPYSGVSRHHYLYDLIYNPEETIFLKWGRERGAMIKNGSDMLYLQAEENWRIWNDLTIE